MCAAIYRNILGTCEGCDRGYPRTSPSDKRFPHEALHSAHLDSTSMPRKNVCFQGLRSDVCGAISQIRGVESTSLTILTATYDGVSIARKQPREPRRCAWSPRRCEENQLLTT